MYNDWRSPELTANLRLRDPVAQVVDIMTGEEPFAGEELTTTGSGDGLRYVVPMKPAQGRILALLKERLARIEVTAPEKIAAGETAKVKVRLLDKDGQLLKQARPIRIQTICLDGQDTTNRRTRHLEIVGEAEVAVPFARTSTSTSTSTIEQPSTRTSTKKPFHYNISLDAYTLHCYDTSRW